MTKESSAMERGEIKVATVILGHPVPLVVRARAEEEMEEALKKAYPRIVITGVEWFDLCFGGCLVAGDGPYHRHGRTAGELP